MPEETPELTIRTWRLIESPGMSGAENMACDEALLEVVGEELARGGRPRVTLRLYSWEPPAVSLGYHQKAEQLDASRLERLGVSVVRRPTGGRAIYHIDELTYAVVGPLSLFADGSSVMATYKTLSAAILHGLRVHIGVEARLARGKPTARPDGRSPVACFQSPASCDAVAGGRKVVGSAQVRRGGGFLQHGSIPLVPREERERAVLLGSGAGKIEALGSLEEAAGRPVAWSEAADALVRGFAEFSGVEFARGELSEREREVMDSRLENTRVVG